jgi:hypothetical protein
MTVDLLRQSGVNVVNCSDELLTVAEGLGLLLKAEGKRVAILSEGVIVEIRTSGPVKTMLVILKMTRCRCNYLPRQTV